MRRSSAIRWLTLATTALSLLSLGCASAQIRKANELALARADARVLEGCYECLRDARDVLQRERVGAPSGSATSGSVSNAPPSAADGSRPSQHSSTVA